MEDLPLLDSEWTRPVPEGPARALDFHINAFAGWHHRAGAEPRLSLVFTNGLEAEAALKAGLDARDMEVVEAPATLALPIHPRLRAHEGTHFNRTLFLVTGLEGGGDPAALLQALDAEVGALRKTATWAAVVVRQPATAAALHRWAPALRRAVERVGVFLHPAGVGAEVAPASPGRVARWLADGQLAEAIHAEALSPRSEPTYAAFARLVRAGYAGLFDAATVHPERGRLLRLWAQPAGPLPFPVGEAGPAAAEAALRHCTSLDPAARAALLARAPLGARVAVGEAAGPWAPLVRARAVSAGEAEAAPDLLGLLQGTHPGEPSLAAHWAHATAGVCGALGDLEGCAAALEQAGAIADAAGVPLELRFAILEQRARLAAFSAKGRAARSLVDALEALAPALQSPLYAGRAALARAEMTQPLDAARAAGDFHRAAHLFERHGAPRWADLARAPIS